MSLRPWLLPQQIHHVAALRTSAGRMAPSAGRLHGHLLLLRSLQLLLHSTVGDRDTSRATKSDSPLVVRC